MVRRAAVYNTRYIAFTVLFFFLISACTSNALVRVTESGELADQKKKTQRLNTTPYRAIHLGEITNESTSEISGIACSRINPDRIWLLNDGGNAPTLYAVDKSGRSIGSVKIAGASNIDWEDMAAFTWRGEHWLLIADTGDNLGVRDYYSLYLLREANLEPKAESAKSIANIATEIRFRYKDGPHDAEAIAIDPTLEQILIVTKREHTPSIYQLPLTLEDQSIQTAEKIGELTKIPPPTLAERLTHPLRSPRSTQPTAVDISADGSKTVILTYLHIYLYSRDDNTPWPEIFLKPPRRLATHDLRQGEAIAFDTESKNIYFTSESLPAPIWMLEQIMPVN